MKSCCNQFILLIHFKTIYFNRILVTTFTRLCHQTNYDTSFKEAWACILIWIFIDWMIMLTHNRITIVTVVLICRDTHKSMFGIMYCQFRTQVYIIQSGLHLKHMHAHANSKTLTCQTFLVEFAKHFTSYWSGYNADPKLDHEIFNCPLSVISVCRWNGGSGFTIKIKHCNQNLMIYLRFYFVLISILYKHFIHKHAYKEEKNELTVNNWIMLFSLKL